ncbi:MAG: DUF5655 domain-containing protein [bacterium]|nr:DUF5655 domain-containing protein [bacterium]
MTTDIKLFDLTKDPATEIPGRSSAVERSLHDLIERHLEAMLGIRLLGSEYDTGRKHGGRIDTLGIDENNSPAIIEYKRSTNQNVINQGLFYMDWLLDHRAEFELLVLRTLGEETADLIDWSAPRLLCIAGGFTRYDEHAVEQMNRNIELIRYRRFGEGLLMLEMVNAVSAATPASTGTRASGLSATKGGAQKTFSQVLASLDGPLLDLYEALRDHILELGDDVQEKTLKRYVAFKRLKNFACIDLRPREGTVLMYLKVDPGTVTLTDNFTRDVREISHYGTGDLEVTMRTPEDLERAKALLQESYDAS